MKKYAKKRVYTYYRLNLKFNNEEELELLKKFKHIKRKGTTIKELLADYLLKE